MSTIVGLDALAGQYGSLEVGVAPGAAQMGEFTGPQVEAPDLGGKLLLQAAGLPKSMVGIPYQELLPGSAVVEMQIDVERVFRPDRFVLGPQSALAPYHVVHDIRVGTISLNASRNSVPAQVFSPGAWGTSIRATMTADPSIGIQLFLQNLGAGEDAPFVARGAFFGPSARPDVGNGRPVAIVGADPGAEAEVDAKTLPMSFVGIPRTQGGASGNQQYIQVPIQRNIRPDRLVWPTQVAEDYDVRDIRVGTTSLNCSRHPVAGAAFEPTAFGTRLRATMTATPSLGIGLETITRVGADPTVICGAFFGPSTLPSS